MGYRTSRSSISSRAAQCHEGMRSVAARAPSGTYNFAPNRSILNFCWRFRQDVVTIIEKSEAVGEEVFCAIHHWDKLVDVYVWEVMCSICRLMSKQTIG